MKAPAAQQLQLLSIQAHDNRLGQLRHQAKNLPEHAQLAELEKSIASSRSTAAAVRGEVDEVRTEIDRLESDVAVVASRLERDRDRMQTSSSARDIQGFEHEIASLEKRRTDLEDIELTLMERQEEIELRLTAARAELDELVTTQESVHAARAAKLAEIDAEMIELMALRADAIVLIDEELLALYDRQRSRYGIGAALLTRGISGGSNVKLHESDLAVIRAAADDDVVLCPDSSCILVRTSESGL